MRGSSHILFIALMVESGLAIKCFNCDSASNERCIDMLDPKIIAEDCYDRPIQLEINYNNFTDHQEIKFDFDGRMVCQKLIGIDENKQRRVVRRCQLKSTNPCIYSSQETVNSKLECYLCEDNACNSSSSNQVFGAMIGVVSAVAISNLFFD